MVGAARGAIGGQSRRDLSVNLANVCVWDAVWKTRKLGAIILALGLSYGLPRSHFNFGRESLQIERFEDCKNRKNQVLIMVRASAELILR